jgi:hypothetical protein
MTSNNYARRLRYSNPGRAQNHDGDDGGCCGIIMCMLMGAILTFAIIGVCHIADHECPACPTPDATFTDGGDNE